jgi:hypothetical protein
LIIVGGRSEFVRATGRADWSLARADGTALGAATVGAGEAAATGSWADPLEHAAEKIATAASPVIERAARTDARDFRTAIPASGSSTSFCESAGSTDSHPGPRRFER